MAALEVRCLDSISLWLLTQCTNALPVTMRMLRIWHPGAVCHQTTLHDRVEKKKGNDDTFRYQYNKKPGNIPGCSKHDPVCNACMYVWYMIILLP